MRRLQYLLIGGQWKTLFHQFTALPLADVELCEERLDVGKFEIVRRLLTLALQVNVAIGDRARRRLRPN